MNKEEQILDMGFDETIFFRNYDYKNALVGVTIGGRAVYDYDKMVKCLVEEEGFSVTDAVEWIDYNTIRSLPYAGENAPIIIYSLEEESHE